MKYKYIQLQIRDIDDLKDRFKKYAAKKGMGMSECLRYLIRKTLEEDAKHENSNRKRNVTRNETTEEGNTTTGQ